MRFLNSPIWRRIRWRAAALWTGGILVTAVLAFFGYMEMVKARWIRYNKWDRREKGSLQVGQQAPDLELPLLDGGKVHLAELWGSQPLVVVFGSCT
jgi:hypothetical protein